MDNSKRKIYNSGALGVLIKNGQIERLEEANKNTSSVSNNTEKENYYFKTSSGVQFTENELIYADPKECEPWKYANRQEDEMGGLEELVESIRDNKQLQPALVRKHPNPHDNIKYEIIFGRRRHAACLLLGIPFLVICKAISNSQEAVISQDAENKFRNNVSPYSNAVLYKRLIDDKIFKTEVELAKKLKISTSSLNEIMLFNRLPKEAIEKIPNIHSLSKNFASKIVSLAKQSEEKRQKIIELSSKIGEVIKSPTQLQRIIEKELSKSSSINLKKAKIYTSKKGDRLFSLKYDQRGAVIVALDKQLSKYIKIDQFCEVIKSFLEEEIPESGYPDL